MLLLLTLYIYTVLYSIVLINSRSLESWRGL
nr:MAG TPA: hypothetical protein [Bacteriophage sp.]